MKPRREQIEEQLLTAHAFAPDLYGYAAVAAAAELIDHWAQCSPPLDVATQRSDIQRVIVALQEWLDMFEEPQGGRA